MTTFVEQFKEQATRISRDLRHRGLIQTALKKYEVARDKKKGAFQDWQSARQAAAETKWNAINHLDEHLVSFADKLEARGTKVHWATSAEQAREIILGIVKAKGARSIIKSKAMTAEEIHLNDALEKVGYEVVESDLGEYIVQLRHEPPYHVVLARRDQLVSDLPAGFALLKEKYSANYPSFMTVITGPSRTGDIERILVLGAHGPKKLTVLCF